MATGSSNPVAIQREIEQTRRELAETVDAIAQKVSPRNVASRSTERFKVQAREQGAVLRTKGEDLRGRAELLAGRAGTAASDRFGDRVPALKSFADRPALQDPNSAVNPGATAAEPIGDSAVTLPGTPGYAEIAAWDNSRQTVRWDRVAMAGGVVTLLLVVRRRRRSHRS